MPVVLGGLSFGECETLAAALARVTKAAPGPTLILASSDMSHYLPDDETRKLDALAMEPLEAPTARASTRPCAATASDVRRRARDGRRARGPRPRREHALRVGYATSADAGGDRDRVVGYAALTFS